MYNLRLHEEEQQLFYSNGDLPQDEHDEEAAEDGENKGPVFLSNMAVQSPERVSFLWDSGASRTVIGKGVLAQRIKDDYLLLFNHEARGWADQVDMNKKVEPVKRARRNIIVASGQAIRGQALEQIDLGVDATTQSREGKWKSTKKQAFLTLTDASVAEDITSNVMAEAHFMMENPNFTLITRGSEKYLVWGKPNITFEAIDGQAPVRIDLRYENG
jgi:hypothetical protein